MRKINLFGATMLALAAGSLPLSAFAQAPAAAPAPAPAAPAPAAPAPSPTPPPAAPADVTPAAPAPDASAPAAPEKPAKPAKKHTAPKKHMGKGKLADTKAGDSAVEDLNAASLDSAKTGKPFTPPATPEAAKKEAHTGDAGTTMHKKAHHKMAKKAKKADAAPPADAAAPAPDASTPK